MSNRFARPSGVVVICLLTWAGILFNRSPALGQQGNTAGIYGNVMDTQGGMIPGVTVTLLRLETNQMWSTKTGLEGQYQFQLLPVGQYKIQAEQPGFQKYERAGLTLHVNENPKVDIQLQVGALTTTIRVQAAAPLVETQSATLREVVDSRRVVDLPLNGRELVDLVFLSPGVVQAYNAHGAPGNESVAGGGGNAKVAWGARAVSINGSRNNETRYTLDGANNDDTWYNYGMPFPFPDAVQEFSIQTAVQGVDVGKSPGGTINIVTKRGTNEFHGETHWFVRNTAVNARDFFSPGGDLLKRNQSGFSLGGPVKKNKVFLFGGYERTWIRQAMGANLVQAIPAAHRTGDFSDLLQGPDPIQLVDPISGQPYQDNKIPQSEWSPAFQKLMQWWPIPPASGFINVPIRFDANIYQLVLRGDYRISEKHSVFARFFRQSASQVYPLQPHNLATSNEGAILPTTTGTIGWTYIVSSNLVTDAHVTGNYSPGHRTIDAPYKSIREMLGVNINPVSTQVDVSLDGTSGFGIGDAGKNTFFRRGLFDAANSWRYMRGKHSFIFGTNWTWSRYNEYNPYHASGVFSFNGQFTGYDQADALIGYLSHFTQGAGELEFRRHHYQGFYFGDAFRVTPRLTLNLGLRWEPFTMITDLRNRAVQFLEDQYLKGARSPMWTNSPPGLFYPGDKVNGYTVPQGGTSNSLDLLGPRFGFAWDVKGDGKTSIRGGYGLFYSTPEIYLLNALSDQTPWGLEVNLIGGYGAQAVPFDDPYRNHPSLNIFPIDASQVPHNVPFNLPMFTYAEQPTFPQTSTHIWNLMIERQFGDSWMVRVGYVGNKATHLFSGHDINAPIYDFSKTLAENQVTIDERRPRPEFEQLFTLFAGLNANYNSLQVSLIKRLSRGLTMTNNYTWSKAIDYYSQNGSIEEDNDILDNPFNPLFYRGLSEYDHRQRFVSSLVYDLPSSAKFVDSAVLDAITRHWTTSGIITLQSGRPFTVRAAGDLVAGAGYAHGLQIGPLGLSNSRPRSQKVAEWFNTANVISPPPGTYGTMGRGTLIGPGLANVDVALFRSIKLPIRESTQLQFRIEAFNLFNRVNLDNPRSTVGRGGFGMITGTLSGPRILQFGAKIVF